MVKTLETITNEKPRVLDQLDDVEQELIRLYAMEDECKKLTIERLLQRRYNNIVMVTPYMDNIMIEIDKLITGENTNGNTSNKT